VQKDLLDSDIIIPIVIAIIMFGIGLDLKFKNFKRVFIEPVGILTGLFAQLVCLPLIAFMLVYFLPIDNIYKVGFVLIASNPSQYQT
jgi:BASS family bile acid:Na+ symporter